MATFIFEWLTTGVRWLHVIAGIVWLGVTFDFQSQAGKFRRRATTPSDAEGDVWEVHGFGFFHTTKYLLPPKSMPPPEELGWFRSQANTTWVSGFALLTLVYYVDAQRYLIDPAVLNLPTWAAIAVSVFGLAAAWLAYDALCRSTLAKNRFVLGSVGLLLFTALAYAYSYIFSARGAFMQLGATIGTIMLANVFFFIIPSLRKMVENISALQRPPPSVLSQFNLRSRHNNYLSLPVVFVMIGNHSPLAFATHYSWLIVSIIVLIGVSIRHFFNTMHETAQWLIWPWCAAALLFAFVIALSVLGSRTSIAAPAYSQPTQIVHFAEIKPIILGRCSMCHSSEPMWPGISTPPKGIILQTSEEILAHAGDINREVVLTGAMPPSNLTGITDAERKLIAQWILVGARDD